MADRLRQLYHAIYDWCGYFQLKIEFSGAHALVTMLLAVAAGAAVDNHDVTR